MIDLPSLSPGWTRLGEHVGAHAILQVAPTLARPHAVDGVGVYSESSSETDAAFDSVARTNLGNFGIVQQGVGMAHTEAMPAFDNAVVQIVRLCPEEEMIWTNTGWSIAT